MKIAVIAKQETDLERLLSAEEGIQVDRLDPCSFQSLKEYDACAVLGGGEKDPLLLPVDQRLALEDFRLGGKSVFCEWCASIGYVYGDEGDMHDTVSCRMVYVGEECEELKSGDLLDDRANTFMGYVGLSENASPVLSFGGHLLGHDRCDGLPSPQRRNYALWLDDASTMICAFRLCNWVQARFAPQKRWDAVLSLVFSFLTGKNIRVKAARVVSTNHASCTPAECFRRGLNWFDGANILIDNGESGVLEGLSHRILPSGKQLSATAVRNDCAGEVGGAYFFDWHLNGNEASRLRFENLQRFCFEKLYETRPPHEGLMRWSVTAWGVCYQDDVARTMLGTLLSMELTGERKYLDRICKALDYMLETTGTDGLRVSRTDANKLTPQKRRELASSPANFPCAHFNGYYMAVLLMVYRLTGEKRYFQNALLGMETLMAAYPDTIREHSETQELCRLLLPLACLYEVTGEEKHRAWLFEVTDRLERYRHPFGGYVEHDTGYKANRSRTAGTESSLLAENGDPVQDLLYSVNWLPLAFSYAFKVTRDQRYAHLWKDLTRFLSEIQMESNDPRLCGAWCRGMDAVRREPYGMPHDVGWGPCAVESGWTVGEILMGIGYGMALGLDG